MTQADGAALPDLRTVWDFNDPAESENRFNQLMSQAESAGLAAVAELKTQIARTYSLRRLFDEAHHILDEVERMPPDIGPRAKALYYLERGRTHNSAGEKEEARKLFLYAYGEATGAGEEFLAIDAAHMMGIVEQGEKSLEWNERAIHMAEQARDERARGWLGSLLNNTAWTYHDMGQHARALELFQNALEFRMERGQPIPIRIAKWSVARCLRSLSRYEEALEIQRELEKDADADGYVFEEIGELLLAQGSNGESKPYFARAHEMLSKDSWLVAEEPDRLARLSLLAS